RTPERAASLPRSSGTGASCRVRTSWISPNRCAISSRRLPLTASHIIDAEATEMAQPLPSKRRSLSRSPSSRNVTCRRSPHNGLWPSAELSAGSRRPNILGLLLWSRMTSRYRSCRSISPTTSRKYLVCLAERGDQRVDVRLPRVTAERRARRRGDVEEFHHWHGTVMPGTHGHAFRVEDGAEVVRVD